MQTLKPFTFWTWIWVLTDPWMLHSPLRLGKHWSCPFLDKVSIISKGNKFTPLYLSLWFPSQCTTWTSASKNLNQQFFFSVPPGLCCLLPPQAQSFNPEAINWIFMNKSKIVMRDYPWWHLGVLFPSQLTGVSVTAYCCYCWIMCRN